MSVDGSLSEGEEKVFLFCEVFFDEISEDELNGGGIDASFDVDRMDKALSIFCRFGREIFFWESFDEFGNELNGVDHLVVGVAWVCIDAVEGDRHGIGAKCFRIEHASSGGIDGVCAIGIEFFDIKIDRAAADFFVGCESDANIAVRNFWVVDEVRHSRHDGGDARFVVGA